MSVLVNRGPSRNSRLVTPEKAKDVPAELMKQIYTFFI